MQNNVTLFYRDRWLEKTFQPYAGKLADLLYRYEFRIEAQVELRMLYVNDELFHTFSAEEQSFDFSLIVAKPFITLRVEYELEEQLYQEEFLLEVTGMLLPRQDYLDGLQKQYLDWQRKVYDYVDVYEEDEIELSEFYEEQNWEATFQQLKNRLMVEDADTIWFYLFRKEITMHLQQILRKPKVKLISQEVLVNAAELDVITPRTIQHFMKDTTTWANTTTSRPVPTQLLKEMNEESIDIYENRFVYTFVFHLEREMSLVLKELKDSLYTIESMLATNQKKIDLNILRADTEFENFELCEFQQTFELALSQLKGLYNLVRQTIKTLKGLKLIQGYVMPNQVLLYNKHYGALYRFYNKFMRAAPEKELKLNDSIDYHSYYTDEVFFTMLQQLQQEGFTHDGPIKLKISEQMGTYIFKKQDRAFTFKHPTQPVEIVITQQKHEIHIVFTHTETMEQQKIRFVPSIVQFHKYVANEQIDELYNYPLEQEAIVKKLNKRKEEITEQEQLNIMVVYPAKNQDDFLKSMRYEQLHLLLSMGMNFIDAQKFQAYGALKYGVFPYANYTSSKNLFQRFLRLQLFKLGIRTSCFMCGEEGRKTVDGDYICANPLCGCEWGVRICQCGAPLYKMQKKSAKDQHYLTEDQQLEEIAKSDVEWLFEKENLNATMGLSSLCENAHLGTNFFIICPNCGDCKQQSKQGRICKRCDALENSACN